MDLLKSYPDVNTGVKGRREARFVDWGTQYDVEVDNSGIDVLHWVGGKVIG